MSKLNLIATIVPVIVVAIGLIGWVTTLRSDINTTQTQLIDVKQDITPLQEDAELCALEIHNLHTLIADLEQIEAVTSEIDVLINRVDSIEEMTDIFDPEIEDLKSSLRVAEDQMSTIMADHSGFNEVLKSLGQAGLLPSGERRVYGGY